MHRDVSTAWLGLFLGEHETWGRPPSWRRTRAPNSTTQRAIVLCNSKRPSPRSAICLAIATLPTATPARTRRRKGSLSSVTDCHQMRLHEHLGQGPSHDPRRVAAAGACSLQQPSLIK